MQARILWARRLGVTCVALTFLLMVLGAWVKANGAGLACPDWPACYGKLVPPFPSLENGGTWEGRPVPYTQAQELYEWTHRAVVAVILVPVAAFALVTARARGLRPGLRVLPSVAVGVYLLQAALGAITVVTGNPPWATTMHLGTAVAWFGLFLAATVLAHAAPLPQPRPAGEPEPVGRQPPPGVRFVFPGEESAAQASFFPGEEPRNG